MEWFSRLRGTSHGQPPDGPLEPRARKQIDAKPEPPKDPNAPIRRLQLHQKCLYERMLPGNAFVSAHVNRLQHGFYENSALHESTLDNVYFVSVHFVFHPHDPRAHRIKSAIIEVSVHGDIDLSSNFPDRWQERPNSSPRILKHAPELIYGAVSPENLQWNFSLSSSLGVSQAPLSATVNPSGGVKSSYKLYDMMSIQGSLRSKQSPLGQEYDVEDAMAVWTLEENLLQRSGLPREFDFVLLVHKPDDVKNVYLTVDVDAVVDAWFGSYPPWYINLPKYQPTQDFTLDFDNDIGQRFLPLPSWRGFNFADLPRPLEEYVTMPGTVYPTNDLNSDENDQNEHRTFDDDPACREPPYHHAIEPSAPITRESPFRERTYRASRQDSAPNRHSWAPETLNVRVMVEHSSPPSTSSRRYSGSPASNQDPTRQRSIRRRRSRTGLNQYSAQQALQDIARDTLKENEKQVAEYNI
ncbi:hypothetical protein BDV95DRAFT_118753 [Massariosphaeria phaeospora]|uniref:Uncharacterized protein n=1 Tax=Massariosphaeria phaeospora TaxID=100035 RepID=A0A7C8MG99_9PLEO|nr:hypothetical protein BDV95DRAFT_118753 [Massariosphaeria phaeospora]